MHAAVPVRHAARRALVAGVVAGVLAGASGTAFAQNIRIGLSTPATGPAATASEWERWGVELAVEDINAAGGLLGRKVELVTVDNRCSPSEGVNATNKLIQDKVVAIIGAHCSSAHLAAMPLVKDAKIPMITGIASSPKITEESGPGKNEWAFRINPSDQDMMVALTKYLGEKKIFRSVAVLAEDSDFGRGGVASFEPLAKAAGINILSKDFHPQNLPDYTTILTRIRQSKPDAIALFQLGGDQINFLRNAMQLGVRIPYTGRAELGGRNAEIIAAGGMENSISAWTYSAAVETPQNKEFVAKIQAKHKSVPYLQTWSGYDSTRMVAQAIRDAKSAEPQAIRDALAKISYTSVLGKTMKFDRNNQAGKVVVLQTVKDRKVGIADLVTID